MKTLRKNSRFPTVLISEEQGEEGGHIDYRFLFLSANQGDTSVFLSLVCIIMASQRALLVVYLVSLVYVRSAKCLGREEVEVMSGWGEVTGRGWGGEVWCGGRWRSPVCPALRLPYIHIDRVLNSALNTSLPPPPPPSLSQRASPTWKE